MIRINERIIVNEYVDATVKCHKKPVKFQTIEKSLSPMYKLKVVFTNLLYITNMLNIPSLVSFIVSVDSLTVKNIQINTLENKKTYLTSVFEIFMT